MPKNQEPVKNLESSSRIIKESLRDPRPRSPSKQQQEQQLQQQQQQKQQTQQQKQQLQQQKQ